MKKREAYDWYELENRFIWDNRVPDVPIGMGRGQGTYWGIMAQLCARVWHRGSAE